MRQNKTAAMKYAKALFSLAGSGEADSIGSHLLATKPIANKEISVFFLSPSIDNKTKVDVINKVFPKLPDKVLNLLHLLIERNDIRLLPDISGMYSILLLNSKNTVNAKVTSAEPVDSASLAYITDILKNMTKKDVILEEETDKTIVAGMVVKIGDVVIDGSLKGKIALMKRELMGA